MTPRNEFAVHMNAFWDAMSGYSGNRESWYRNAFKPFKVMTALAVTALSISDIPASSLAEIPRLDRS